MTIQFRVDMKILQHLPLVDHVIDVRAGNVAYPVSKYRDVQGVWVAQVETAQIMSQTWVIPDHAGVWFCNNSFLHKEGFTSNTVYVFIEFPFEQEGYVGFLCLLDACTVRDE